MSTPTNDDSQLSADKDSYESADVEVSTDVDINADTDVSSKPNGLGEDGTIPNDPNGVAAGHTGTASNFNPEEDKGAH